MIPDGVSYQRFRNLEEICRFMEINGPSARPYAGGSDLLVQLRENKIRVKDLVDIKECSDLKRFQVSEGERVILGSLTTIKTIESSELLRKYCPGLSSAAAQLGSCQVRNRATLGGNLCNASPAAELATPLLALGARARLVSSRGERLVALEDFFLAPGQTALVEAELLQQIEFDWPEEGSRLVYFKVGLRRAMEIAILNLSLYLSMVANSRVELVRIALGSVAPTPIRARAAEAVLVSRVIIPELIERAADAAMQEAAPIDDVRASAAYRRKLVRVYIRRALNAACERIGSQ